MEKKAKVESSEKDNKDRLKDSFLYEGEFYNNLKNGIGKKMEENGDYYYGSFVAGLK